MASSKKRCRGWKWHASINFYAPESGKRKIWGPGWHWGDSKGCKFWQSANFPLSYDKLKLLVDGISSTLLQLVRRRWWGRHVWLSTWVRCPETKWKSAAGSERSNLDFLGLVQGTGAWYKFSYRTRHTERISRNRNGKVKHNRVNRATWGEPRPQE